MMGMGRGVRGGGGKGGSRVGGWEGELKRGALTRL